jgi:hypothetical protein
MTDVHVVEGSFTHPELTERYRPYPIAGRGIVKFTHRGVELEGLEPARGLPPLLQGCVLLMCLYLPIWLPVFLLAGTSFTLTKALASLSGLVGMALMSGYVIRLMGKKRDARPDRPRRARLPWKRVWSIGLEGTLFEVRRGARSPEMRFRVTRAPAPDGEPAELRTVSFVVGHWGGRQLVTFVLDGDATDLRDHLEGLRVSSGA